LFKIFSSSTLSLTDVAESEILSSDMAVPSNIAKIPCTREKLGRFEFL
jgi:hypothetical protein